MGGMVPDRARPLDSPGHPRDAHLAENFRAGDVLLFSGRDRVSTLIKLASVPLLYWPGVQLALHPLARQPHWRWISHVAICCDWHSEVILVESTTMNDEPCLVRHVRIDGVQAHEPKRRIAGYPGVVWRMRPAPGWELTNARRDELTRFVHWQFGEGYDFAGAARSASWLPDVYRQAVRFCSDLAAACLTRIGYLAVSNPKGYTPSGLAGALYRNGNFVVERLVKSDAHRAEGST